MSGTDPVDETAGAEMEDAASRAQIEKFKTESKKLMDDNKDHFKDFARAFIVLQDHCKYDEAAKVFKHRHVCHKQAVGGDEEKQAKAKELLATITGEWEPKDKFFI